MGQITINQSHLLMATLAVNTNWEKVDFEESGLQDLIMSSPIEAGRRFTTLLEGGLMPALVFSTLLKTIKTGTGPKTADEFRTAIKEADCEVSDWANDLFGRPGFTAATQEEDVELVVLTAAQLTSNSNGGTTAEVFAGAARLGLEKCAPDDGPQLRRQYPDQPLGECLRMGMEPIADSSGCLHVFRVEHDDDGLWLRASYAFPYYRWSGGSLWVFRRRK